MIFETFSRKDIIDDSAVKGILPSIGVPAIEFFFWQRWVISFRKIWKNAKEMDLDESNFNIFADFRRFFSVLLHLSDFQKLDPFFRKWFCPTGPSTWVCLYGTAYMGRPQVPICLGPRLRDHNRVADLIVAHRLIDRSAIRENFIL